MRLKLCCAAVAVALAIAGCGDDSGSSSSTGDQAASTTSRPVEVLHYPNELPRPKAPGPHPNAKIEQLIVRDVRRGVGPAIKAGDIGMFDFIGSNWVTGERLDGSWRRRRAFETAIEKGVVIDGWWQGIPGMRVGGRRQIIVPPTLGFQQSLVPGLAGTTTYFDILLMRITPATPRALQTPEQQRASSSS